MSSNPPTSGASRAVVASLLAGLDRDLGAVRDLRAAEAALPEIRELRNDLDDQLVRAKSAAVICLVGSTGAGKSTLLNALVGREVAVEGVDRPTTSAPVIYRPSDADVSSILEGLPGEPPTVVTYEPSQGADAEAGGAESFWRGQILIDAPDTNSVATVHREVVKQLSARADVLVVVAHRQSIAELSSATFIDLFAERRGMVFVLGRTDELDERSTDELLAQLRKLRDERWRSPEAPVVAISARAAKADPGAGNLPTLRTMLSNLIVAEKLGSVRRRNAVGTVARIGSLITSEAQDFQEAAAALEDGLSEGANAWCGGLVAAIHERLEVRRADLARMLWNDAAKVWDGPGGYALRVGGLSAIGMGAGAAVARRNPVLAAGLAVGSLAADRVRGAVRERSFESTSGLLPGSSEVEALQRDAFLEARLAAEDVYLEEAGAAMAPSAEELDGHAARAVDDAWDRLVRVDLPKAAERAVPRALRLLIDLPVYGLGAWVLFRVGMGFFRDQYVGVDFLVSAVIIAFAWLFLARVMVRGRLSARSAALLGEVRGDIEQRLGRAAHAAIDGRQDRLHKSREALARLGSADAIWRERLHGESPRTAG
ncbi:dynamin family protein [Saltatorellus ferox]|uniref:dynamin family protein n=1 Tax=Saltatorellus ferox TaxID=2528018 RepID=UPI003AF3EAD1